MKTSRLWARVDRHPYWLATAYLIVQCVFLVAFRGSVKLWFPDVADATWQDPRVVTMCAVVLTGSILTAAVLYGFLTRSWHTTIVCARMAQSRLILYPVLSGFCTALIAPTSLLFYLVHGPLFALVVLRGTGFVAARVVDEVLYRHQITNRPVTRREDGVALLAAFVVWLGIVCPAGFEPGPAGPLLAQAWLFPAYICAYTLRLWFINVFTLRCRRDDSLGRSRRARTPFFLTIEQAALTAAFILLLLIVAVHSLVSERHLDFSIAMHYWRLAFCGIPLGVSAILAVSLLLLSKRTATHNFTLYRIAAGIAGTLALIVLWACQPPLGQHSPFPMIDALLALALLFALFLLSGTRRIPPELAPKEASKSRRRFAEWGREAWTSIQLALGTDPKVALGERQPGDDKKEPVTRTRLRFVRFVFVVAALVYIAPSTNSILRIISQSPYRTNVNPIAVLGELLYTGAANALPVFAIVALLLFIFQVSSAARDAAELTDYAGAGMNASDPIEEPTWWRIDTAAKRLTLVVGIMSGLIALGVWMQGGIAGRSAVASELSSAFDKPEVIEGRRMLRADSTGGLRHDPEYCVICETLRAHLRGDTIVVVDHSTHVALPAIAPGKTGIELDPLHALALRETLKAVTRTMKARGRGQPTLAYAEAAWDSTTHHQLDSLRTLYDKPGHERDAVRVAPLVATLNAVESVLEARRTGALSEIEFHSVWAGVTHEVLDSLQVHLDGNRPLYNQLQTYLPMLCQQMSTQPWPSDAHDSSSLAVMRCKREYTHGREPNTNDLKEYRLMRLFNHLYHVARPSPQTPPPSSPAVSAQCRSACDTLPTLCPRQRP